MVAPHRACRHNTPAHGRVVLKELLAPHTYKYLGFLAGSDYVGHVKREREKQVKVLAYFMSVDIHHSLSGNGLEIQLYILSRPVGRHGKVFFQPSHQYVVPLCGI